MKDDVKYISITEFRELGFLQEVNRQFLHMHGLALETVIGGDGEESLGGIWDYREDPEGIVFGNDIISGEKAETVLKEREKHSKARKEILGGEMQLIGWQLKD